MRHDAEARDRDALTPGAANDAPPARRRLSRRRKLLFAGVTLLALAGGAEGYARVREKPAPGEDDGGLLMRHPRLGFSLRPGFRGKSHSGFGVRVQVSVNERGMRDSRLDLPKPPGTFRIACLGGSTTFGFGATSNATAWPNVLEASYRGRAPVDVLNAGVHSWTLRSSLNNLDEGLRDAELDALVVLHGHNDLYDSFDPAYAAAARGEAYSPPVPSWFMGLLERSAFVRRYRRKTLRWRRRNLKADHLSSAGLEAFQATLEELVRRASERRLRLLLCTFPHSFPRSAGEAQAGRPDRWEEFLRHSVHAYPVFLEGLRRYNQAIRDAAAAHGVPLCDLAREMPKEPELYVDFVHHSDAGHAAKARLIRAAIDRAGWLAP